MLYTCDTCNIIRTCITRATFYVLIYTCSIICTCIPCNIIHTCSIIHMCNIIRATLCLHVQHHTRVCNVLYTCDGAHYGQHIGIDAQTDCKTHTTPPYFRACLPACMHACMSCDLCWCLCGVHGGMRGTVYIMCYITTPPCLHARLATCAADSCVQGAVS